MRHTITGLVIPCVEAITEHCHTSQRIYAIIHPELFAVNPEIQFACRRSKMFILPVSMKSRQVQSAEECIHSIDFQICPGFRQNTEHNTLYLCYAPIFWGTKLMLSMACRRKASRFRSSIVFPPGTRPSRLSACLHRTRRESGS